MIQGSFGSGGGRALEQPRRSTLVFSFPRLRLGRWTLFVLLLLAALLIVGRGTGFSYRPITEIAMTLPSPTADAGPKELSKLRAQHKAFEATLRQRSPRGTYVIIDQTLNRIYLKNDDATLLEAKCSAGSGMVLEEGGGKGRRWIFDTPRGQFKVLQKISNPVWKKPDWAFVEEGKPIPRNPEDRFEYGTLGEYALHFGNGYMIHGTLYERLLGRSVTHGCIRLGKEDLRKVWSAVPVGTPIYIY